MPIIGFNFNKVDAKKTKPLTGKINIKQDVKIISVEKDTMNLVSTEDTLRFGFSFSVMYEPGVGNINLNGSILYLTEPKVADSILKSWNKDKKFEDDRFFLALLNTVIAKSSVKALTLAEELNLPPHINLPRIQKQPKKKN